MRLVAIFHCWSDWKLLRYAVDNIRQLVEGVIIIGSTRSNYGEFFQIPAEWHNDELYVREPKFNVPLHSETDKRNYGLQIAREKGYSHFITMDADEFYKPDEFLKVKEWFKHHPLDGLVCPSVVYFASPKLTIGRDVTLVPHIHKLTRNIQHEFNHRYPFAGHGNQIRIDPTRSLNIVRGVEYTEEIELHHLSWVRDDYNRKIRNSTARNNILKDKTLLHSLMHAKEGDYIEFYRTRLARATVDFGIPEIYEATPL